MELGAFSVSLSVSDLPTSVSFYQKLGFESLDGAGDGEAWQMLRNGTTTIGLFQGMFDDNMLTFNPGWTAENEAMASFTDIRTIRDRLVGEGLDLLDDTTQDSGEGPASFAVVDPDGNPVLFDQHV